MREGSDDISGPDVREGSDDISNPDMREGSDDVSDPDVWEGSDDVSDPDVWEGSDFMVAEGCFIILQLYSPERPVSSSLKAEAVILPLQSENMVMASSFISRIRGYESQQLVHFFSMIVFPLSQFRSYGNYKVPVCIYDAGILNRAFLIFLHSTRAVSSL